MSNKSKNTAPRAKIKAIVVENKSSVTKASVNTVNQKSKEIKMSKTAATPFDKIMKDNAGFGTECSEACTKSSAIFMKGFEDIMGTMVSLAQSSAEKQSQFMKEAMSSKTINEFADVQNKMAQANFDDFMAGATKISELSVKVLTEGSEPVNSQVTKAMQKASETMAA